MSLDAASSDTARQARATAPVRRCRPRPRPPGEPRPSDTLIIFFVPALAFLAAGAAAEIVHAAAGWQAGHWLALHLAFVGGISQLVLGAGQFFAGAFLATAPPPKKLVRLQLLSWNGGTLLVVWGVLSSHRLAVLAGGILLAAGLVAFVAGLELMRRRSLQRAPWAVRWYEACAGFLGVGVLVGVLLASGTSWKAGSLLGAHMALNLAGWLGTAIVGTLHTFFPSLTQTRLRFAGLQRPTFAAWTLGVGALAAGYAFDLSALALGGWACLVLASALLCTNLASSLRSAPTALSLPARLVAAGQLCLMLGLLAGLISTLSHGTAAPAAGAQRAAIAVLLLPGWLGLTVSGSLLHLLSVLGRVRDLRRALPTPRPVRDRLIVAVALVGVLALAAARHEDLSSLDAVAGAAVATVYAVLGALVLARTARALPAGPRRI